MITYRDIVEGDFAIAPIAVRLLAPNPQALMKHMPDATEEQSLANWESYSRRFDWNEEAQSVRYIANFVHEYVHLLQHTSLFQCMHQVYRVHELVLYTDDKLRRIREYADSGESSRPDLWPPKVPLFAWLSDRTGSVAGPIIAQWIEFGAQHHLYLGDEEFVKHYCETLGQPQEELFPSPFNPRFRDLGIKGEWEDVALTTRTLLESQASALTYRFIATFYGMQLANYLVLGPPEAKPDPVYHLLTVAALLDVKGMIYVLPLLIDWSLGGIAHRPIDHDDFSKKFKTWHPPWRFTSLYRAARELLAAGSEDVPDRFPCSDEKQVAAFRQKIHERAGLMSDDPAAILEWVEGMEDIPLKKVLGINAPHRLHNEGMYAAFEANLPNILQSTCAPLVTFREDPLRYHPGRRIDQIDEFRLEFYARKLFNLNRMIEGLQPRCPFCQGVQYESASGAVVTRIPSVGQRGWITQEAKISELCNCGWALEFRETWGALPEHIEYFEKKEDSV